MDAICVLFILCPQSRFSFASVVFDFNAPLNDDASVSPIRLPVDNIQHKPVKQYLFWTVF